MYFAHSPVAKVSNGFLPYRNVCHDNGLFIIATVALAMDCLPKQRLPWQLFVWLRNACNNNGLFGSATVAMETECLP